MLIRVLFQRVPLEYSIKWLTCAFVSWLDLMVVSLPGAVQDRLLAQWRGRDHLEVLLSPAYRLLRCLFVLLAVLVRPDPSKDAELIVLRHENQMLRRQLRGRLRWDHASRRGPGRPSTGASVRR